MSHQLFEITLPDGKTERIWTESGECYPYRSKEDSEAFGGEFVREGMSINLEEIK